MRSIQNSVIKSNKLLSRAITGKPLAVSGLNANPHSKTLYADTYVDLKKGVFWHSGRRGLKKNILGANPQNPTLIYYVHPTSLFFCQYLHSQSERPLENPRKKGKGYGLERPICEGTSPANSNIMAGNIVARQKRSRHPPWKISSHNPACDPTG